MKDCDSVNGLGLVDTTIFCFFVSLCFLTRKPFSAEH